MRIAGRLLVECCVVLVFLMTGPAGAAPAFGPEPWARWLVHDDTSMERIDHSAWERFLLTYLRPDQEGVYRLAYGRVSAGDRAALDGYLRQLSQVEIADYRRSEQLAYWINLYNALIVDLVLDHYPIASIRDARDPDAGRFGGPWERTVIDIDQVPLSLNDIETRIVKPIAEDPRIIYALSCGALGCPNLQPEPYSGDRLDQQLSDAAMAYVNDPRCISIRGDRLVVSSLYRWNIEDFGGSDEGIIHHLLAYAEPDLAMALQDFDHIDGDGFDWRLNDAVP